MLTATVEKVMAKAKRGRPAKGKSEVTARIDVEVMRKVKYLANVEKTTIGEYLTGLLEPIVSKRYIDQLNRELRGETPAKKGKA